MNKREKTQLEIRYDSRYRFRLLTKGCRNKKKIKTCTVGRFTNVKGHRERISTPVLLYKMSLKYTRNDLIQMFYLVGKKSKK